MAFARPRAPEMLARTLILDELFDLSLYKALREVSTGNLRKILEELIVIESKHFAFWQDFFRIKLETLDAPRRLKLALLVGTCRLFGEKAIHLALEAIEVYGVRKYLSLWEAYRGDPLGEAVREVLEDEFRHEDRVVTELIERKIDPEKIRNLFLGFNDGLVEILGAISGFFAAFRDLPSITIAGLTVAVAGSFSMAAGAFAASSSEKEVKKITEGKRKFLGETAPPAERGHAPLGAALLVGMSYFFGAMVPVLPVLFGAKSMLVPLATGAGITILVSLTLAFLSGMDVKKRVAINLLILSAAMTVTYAISAATKRIWGISLS